jgi:pyruvate kinase
LFFFGYGVRKMRRTKIIATLGPACTPEVLKELLAVPVAVFRINASHGNHASHQMQIAAVRRLSEELDCCPGILFDLQGPKIRLGRFEGGAATLTSGSTFTITADPMIGDALRASTDYSNLAADVNAGDTTFPIGPLPRDESSDHAHIAADACCRAAQAPQIEAIIVFTTTGATARLIARCRPSVPIFAFAPTDEVVRSLSIVYGIRAFRGVDGESTPAMIETTDEILMRSGYLALGSSVVVSAGEPIGKPGSANQIRLHRVGLAPGDDGGSLGFRGTSSEHRSEVVRT